MTVGAIGIAAMVAATDWRMIKLGSGVGVLAEQAADRNKIRTIEVVYRKN